MQHKLSQGKLLDENGNLFEAGYATELVKEYSRKDIKAGKLRIKEWDYYLISDGEKAVALTLDDNSYMSMASVSFLDFKKPGYITKSQIKFFSLGKLNFPSSYHDGDINYQSKNVKGSFLKQGDKRVLRFEYKKFDDKNKANGDFACEFILTDEPRDKMVIATPFNKKGHFYYNAKINCMRAEGYARIGDTTYNFSKDNALATLDWGRGVWTYKNEWYWGSLQATLDDGKTFGFNIGYGFGDTSAASENMIFYDGVAHKLEDVSFNIPQKENGKGFDYMKDWTFTDNLGRFNLTFKPVIDRFDNTDLIVLGSCQHQVFGLLSGEVVLDDGTKVEFKDKLGFAEHVKNKW